MMCDRYSLSDHASACVAIACLEAYKIVCGSNMENVVNKSNLRREVPKYREELRKKEKDVLEFVQGISINGILSKLYRNTTVRS